MFVSHFRLAFILYSLALALHGPAHGQSVPRLSSEAYISVLTILPGEPLYSAFGHTAIRVRDDSLGIDAIYNYGTFDFDTDWFYVKFARGLLDYRLARDRFADVLRVYTGEQRPIIEQRLLLEASEIQGLVLGLERNYLPENRFYRYDFFFDNCSTRPRDVLETVSGDRTLGTDVSRDESFRDLIRPYLIDRPWTRFSIDMLLGSLTDQPATDRQRMFLPDGLMHALNDTRSGSRPLSAAADTLFWPRGYERGSRSFWFGPTIIFFVLLVGGTVMAFRPPPSARFLEVFDASLFFVTGMVGVVILALWFGTQHTVTGLNWNILWALPSHLGLTYAIARGTVGRFWKSYLFMTLGAMGAAMATWVAGFQTFHPATIPLVLLIAVRTVAIIRQS